MWWASKQERIVGLSIVIIMILDRSKITGSPSTAPTATGATRAIISSCSMRRSIVVVIIQIIISRSMWMGVMRDTKDRVFARLLETSRTTGNTTTTTNPTTATTMPLIIIATTPASCTIYEMTNSRNGTQPIKQ